MLSQRFFSWYKSNRNLPDEAKDEVKAIAGKASAELRKEMRRPKETVKYPYRFSLSEEVVKQIMR